MSTHGKEECGAYYGLGVQGGKPGTGICRRPKGHPEFQTDQIGHSQLAILKVDKDEPTPLAPEPVAATLPVVKGTWDAPGGPDFTPVERPKVCIIGVPRNVCGLAVSALINMSMDENLTMRERTLAARDAQALNKLILATYDEE